MFEAMNGEISKGWGEENEEREGNEQRGPQRGHLFKGKFSKRVVKFELLKGCYSFFFFFNLGQNRDWGDWGEIIES